MTTKAEEVSRYEWLAAALGGLIFLGLLGFFAREATRSEGTPDIVVRVDSVRSATAGHIAFISARNAGGAATSVRIVGELSRNGAVVETADIMLELLGRRSTQSAGLYFSRDPAQHDLRVRPVSFLVP